MTLAQDNPVSVPEQAKDRHSRSTPAGSSGPAKDSVSHPGGAAVLGTELGGQADARRERQDAIAQGDVLPSGTTARSTAQDLGFGQVNGAEAGLGSLPTQSERDAAQSNRNAEIHSGQPSLTEIARNSNATASSNPQADRGNVRSSAKSAPGELLDQVGTSTGVPEGTGAYDGTVSRDADTNA